MPAPERIWLQDAGDYDGAMQALRSSDDGITWCDVPVDDSDTCYVRADLHDRLVARVTALEEALAGKEKTSDHADPR